MFLISENQKITIDFHCLFKKHVTETGLCDYDKLISPFFKARFSIRRKIEYYSDYKISNEENVL